LGAGLGRDNLLVTMRALVLSGGGANGDYQVGALQHIIGDLGVKYDAFCGVSVGALNGAFLAQFSDGQEKESIDLLEVLWDSIDDDAIIKKWCHGLLGNLPGILWKDSVYSTEPLRDLVRRNLDTARLKASGKQLRVGAVAWGSGDYQLWTEKDDDAPQGVLASSSFPLFFEDTIARGVPWTDGGLRNITPLKAAIDLGADRIDVIRCSPGQVGGHVERHPGKLTKVKRMLEILLDEVERGDLARALDINDLCQAVSNGNKELLSRKFIDIRVLAPHVDLGDSLDFDPVKNKTNRQRGYRDASSLSWV